MAPIAIKPAPDFPHKLRVGSRVAVFDLGWVVLSPVSDEFEVIDEIEEWAKLNIYGGFAIHAEIDDRYYQKRAGYVSGMNLDSIEFVFSFENLNDLIYFKLRWFQ